MSGNVLVLVDKYLPNPSSNGACAANIVNALKQKGYSVQIITIYDSTGEGIICLNKERLSSSYYNKLFRCCEDENTVNDLFRVAMERNAALCFDFVIAFFRPIETLLCGYKLYKRNRIPFYPVFLDVIDIPAVARWKNSIFKGNFIRLVRTFTKEGILCHCLKYYAAYFKSYGLFPRPIGIPNLTAKPSHSSGNGYTELVYAGSFYEEIRNPGKVLSFLRFIKGTNVRLHLFSWGCEDIVEQYRPDFGENIVLHGRNALSVTQEALSGADVLVNISNDDDKAVPGKIIEYFSYGKPILNFYFRDDDPAMDDYRKYPAILNLHVDELNDKEKTVLDFLRNNKNGGVPYAKVEEMFYDCTGQYLIDSVLSDQQEEK